MATLRNGFATPKPFNDIISGLPTTIFSVMTALSIKHNSINLGQGFPDEEGPESMKRIITASITDHSNQYPPLMGLPELRQAVARHSEKFNQLPVSWETETLITIGATEAIASVFLGLLNTGDEVIMFDPMYDCYGNMCSRAGGVVVPVPLNPIDWSIPREALAAAFTPHTKLLLINTPHNPTGHVVSRGDLDFVAELCIRHNVYVLSDEVYEHIVFEGHQHRSIRSIPGMAERTLRIGSAGKTFSFTDWKVGYIVGPAPMIAAVTKAHQFVVFTVPSSLQRAVAYGLDHEEHFYRNLGASLHQNRAFLDRRLPELGFRVLPGQGTYFLVADIRPLIPSSSFETDVEFCQRLTTGAGVTLIPVSAFYYGRKEAPNYLVRFCYCKSHSKLKMACDKMAAYFLKQE